MRIRLVLLLASLLTVGVPRADAQFNRSDPAPGENFNLEIGAMLWTPTPELNIQTGALAAIGEAEVDFVREFGVEKKRFTEFRGVLKGGKHKVRLSHVPIEYHAEATLSRAITFGGRTFTVGLPATADLQWKLWKIGYEYDLVSRGRGFFGLIGELKYNQISASLSSALATEATAAKAPVPTVGVIGRAYPSKNFSITAEFTGFKLPDKISDRFDATLTDFDIYGTVSFGRHVGVQGGYRSLVAEYLVEDDAGHLKLKGTYFGGVLRF